MKTKYHFVFTKIKSTIRRTYGGENYTLAVYRIVKGETIRLGEVKACSAAHKGERSEAWSVAFASLPARTRNTMLAWQKAASGRCLTSIADYTDYVVFEHFGIKLERL